eukprot:scaffold3925_cov188-Prasinococcus_capsulatus_cf.AAC.1
MPSSGSDCDVCQGLTVVQQPKSPTSSLTLPKRASQLGLDARGHTARLAPLCPLPGCRATATHAAGNDTTT